MAMLIFMMQSTWRLATFAVLWMSACGGGGSTDDQAIDAASVDGPSGGADAANVDAAPAGDAHVCAALGSATSTGEVMGIPLVPAGAVVSGPNLFIASVVSACDDIGGNRLGIFFCGGAPVEGTFPIVPEGADCPAGAMRASAGNGAVTFIATGGEIEITSADAACVVGNGTVTFNNGSLDVSFDAHVCD